MTTLNLSRNRPARQRAPGFRPRGLWLFTDSCGARLRPGNVGHFSRWGLFRPAPRPVGQRTAYGPSAEMARDTGNRRTADPREARATVGPHGGGPPGDRRTFYLLSRRKGGRTGSPGEAGGKWRPGEIGAGVAASQRGVGGGGAISPGLGRRGAGTAVFCRPGRGGGRFRHFPPPHFEVPRMGAWMGARQAATFARERFES